MNDTKVIYWARSLARQGGDRYVADTTGTLLISQRHALAVAKEIDTFGQRAVDNAITKCGARPAKHTDPKVRAASGHGVEIVYKSGAKRNVRHD